MKPKIGDTVQFKKSGITGTVEKILRGTYVVKTPTSKMSAWPEDLTIVGLSEVSLEKEMEEHQRICNEIMAIQGIEPIEAETEEVWHCPKGYIFKDENGNVVNTTKIVLEKLVVPKFKKGDKIKDKNNRVWYVVHIGNKHFDISCIPDGSGYFVPIKDQDDYELFPNRELPKTYEECLKVLGYDDRETYCVCHTYANERLFESLYRLKVCRDAYWKIAGEEMGLGKPWEPDWNNVSDKYCIYFVSGYAWSKECQTRQCPFAFPTPEMRDAFKENFDPDIEICKEFL